MSGQPSTVSDCVTAVCSAYHEACTLIQQINVEKKTCSLSAQELEASLIRGQSAIGAQYERIQKRLGESAANSDLVAGDALKDISVHLQEQVVANLKTHLQQDSAVDFFALQDAANSSHDRAILALMQLQQRMVTSGPIANITPSLLNPTNTITRVTTAPQAVSQLECMLSSSLKLSSSEDSPRLSNGLVLPSNKSITPSSVVVSSAEVSPERLNNTGHRPSKSTSSGIRPLTPPGAPFSSQHSQRPGSSFPARESADIASTARREANQYRPLATTTTTPVFFGIGKRTKVEPVVSPPENPLIDEYLADATERESKRLSRSGSISTTATSLYQPDHPAFNTWETYRAPSPTFSHISHNSQDSRKDPSPTLSHRATASINSIDSMRRVPTVSREILASNRSLVEIDPKDRLPSEMNKFAGFCKGAWRQQIGDRKRAMEERVRPGGMYNAAKFWQCKQCKFEGRLVPLDNKKNGYDTRVFKLVQGIQFRWEFMFKSHIRLNEPVNGDPTKATFGCIFCCSEAGGTPQFEGIANFMQHLVVHRDPLPGGEVLYRMNCLIGRQATMEDDFDINIISNEGTLM